jgi:hypothetical protein
MVLFGLMTLRRIVQRNVTTARYKEGLRRIRAVLIQHEPTVASVFAFPPERTTVTRSKRGARYGFGAGGLLETTAALNAALASIGLGGVIWMLAEHLVASLFSAAIAFLVAWIGQLEWAHRLYRQVTAKEATERVKNLDAWSMWAKSR